MWTANAHAQPNTSASPRSERVAAGSGQQEQAERGHSRRGPGDVRHRDAEDEQAEQRRQHDEQAGDEARVRGARVLQPERLEDVARRQEDAHHESRAPAVRTERAQRAPREEPDQQARRDEAVGEERQRRQLLDRVLDHHERQPPDGRDADQGDLGEAPHGPSVRLCGALACRGSRRRAHDVAQVLPGVGVLDARDVLGRAGGDQPPPSSPPSGPRSMIQSAVLITSRLCSITTTVLPASTSRPEHLEQPLHVGEVQAGRGLVQDVQRRAGRDLRQLGRRA